MKFLKSNPFLLVTLFVLLSVSQPGQAANTGPVHAMEGMIGPKYTGAPSQSLAGKMGLLFQDLKDDMNIIYSGKITNTAPLKKIGYKTFVRGDEIEMKRTSPNTWVIRHKKTNKKFTLKVLKK